MALRTATPPDLIDYMGVALSDREPERWAAFAAQARAMAEVTSLLYLSELHLEDPDVMGVALSDRQPELEDGLCSAGPRHG